MNRTEMAEEIRRLAYLRGSFTLRSGATSDQYFDKYRFESDPGLLREIAVAMAPMVPQDADVLAGLELGGVPLATLLSQLTGLPTLFVRKEPKSYGTRRLAEGGDVEGRSIAIVEDISTTGGQIVKSAQELVLQGGRVSTALVVIDRGQGGESNLGAFGIELRSLFSAEEIVDSLTR